jgi:hypothetical protein
MKFLALAVVFAFSAGSLSAFAPSTTSSQRAAAAQRRSHVFQLEMANGSKRKLALKVRRSVKLVFVVQKTCLV